MSNMRRIFLIGDKMKVYIEKIGLMRPKFNPKNQKLNLDLNWGIDYKNTEGLNIKYDCTLKTFQTFPLNFKTEGILKLEENEEFLQEEISQIIFDKSFEMFMEMISLTKDYSANLKEINNVPTNKNLNETIEQSFYQ